MNQNKKQRVHFGPSPERSLCDRTDFDSRAGHVRPIIQTSLEASEVTCKRCLRRLGFAPAQEQDEGEEE